MKKGDLITVVLEVENPADAEAFQRSIGSVLVNGCKVKSFATGDAVKDAQALMDENALRSHDGIDA